MKLKNKKVKEEAYQLHPTLTETFQMVRKGIDTVVFEGGWWMTREDWEKTVPITYLDWQGQKRKEKKNLILTRNERTRQITWAFPPKP